MRQGPFQEGYDCAAQLTALLPGGVDGPAQQIRVALAAGSAQIALDSAEVALTLAPRVAPDGRFVLFNRSPSNRNSMDNAAPSDAGVPDGQLWSVPSNGGAPVHLVNASPPRGTSWPKWAPGLPP